jgi:hypothetical protein
MRKGRFGWLIAPFCGGLVVLLVLSGVHLLHSRSAAYASAQNLDTCRELADQIVTLRSAPAQASLERRTLQDLSRKIEQAAQIAEIPGSAIVSINPQPGRRIGNSALMAHPTSIQFRETPLKHLVRFLIELAADESGLEATSLRLKAPRIAPLTEAEERWTVELVLTYLVFSPEYAPVHPEESGKARSK